MNISKNKNRITEQIRKGLDLAGSDMLYAFGNDEDAVTCIVKFEESEQYCIVVRETGHFYINDKFDSQRFSLKAFIKPGDDLELISQTIKLVLQGED